MAYNKNGQSIARCTLWVPRLPTTSRKAGNSSPKQPGKLLDGSLTVPRAGTPGQPSGWFYRNCDDRKADFLQRRRDTVELRVGSVNVGTMREKSAYVVEMASRRNLDFCCLQETLWKGRSARILEGGGKVYKFIWSGGDKAEAGVGVLVAEKWINDVNEVERVSDRIMRVRLVVGGSVLNLVSAYAPQAGRPLVEKQRFWEVMTRTVSNIRDDESVLVCGDLNGHVGAECDGYEGVHGGQGYGSRNVEGEMVLDFAVSMDLMVANTFFKKESAKKVTYESGEVKSVVDYILLRKKERVMVRDVKVIPSEDKEDFLTQHKLLVCSLRLERKYKKKQKKAAPRCRIWKLKVPDIRNKYAAEVKAISAVRVKGTVEERWNEFKKCFTETADRLCGKASGRSVRRETWWWNDKVAAAIKEKQRLFRKFFKSKSVEDREEYQVAKKAARREVAIAKELGHKKLGELLDSAEEKGNLYKVMNQMTKENKDVVGGGCVKNETGKVEFDDDRVRQIWKDYFEKLLNEEFEWKRESLGETAPVSGPVNETVNEISIAEVADAVKEMKLGKAAGPSGVVAEMVKLAGDDGIIWMKEIFNQVIHEGKIPDDWRKSWMVTVYKGKGDALDCGSYRGIKLLDQVMKVFERVIDKRLSNIVKVDDMQFGFSAGKGTTDAIFVVRQVQERVLDKDKDLWLAFIDLEKAFDRVPREVLWWALRQSGVEEWLINIIIDMYKDVTTAVLVNGEVSESFEVKVGVHQGSVLSPRLFIIVLDALSRSFRTGLPWELFYADDLILMAETRTALLDKIEKWKAGLEDRGLRVNTSKTKVMVSRKSSGQSDVGHSKWPCGVCRKGVGRNSILCTSCNKWIHKECSKVKGKLTTNANFQCDACLGKVVAVVKESNEDKFVLKNGKELEYVDKFCYLGDTIAAAGGAEHASCARTQRAWGAFRERLQFLTSPGASLKLKGKIYKTCVQTVLTYGSETWPMKVVDEERLSRCENSMVRWMCGVSLKKRLPTAKLLEWLGIESVLDIVRRGRLRWFGHVERKPVGVWVKDCQSLVVEGKRGRGRSKKSWRQCVDDDLKLYGLTAADALKRDFWRERINREPSNPLVRRNPPLRRATSSRQSGKRDVKR